MHFKDNTLMPNFPTNSSEKKGDRHQSPASDREFGIRVEIDEDVYRKVQHWVDKSEFEVSGLGMVEYDEEENVLRVTDAILLPQKNTEVATEIDGSAVARAMYLMKDKPGTLRWWWHSHVDMEVFWSRTDVDTIKELGSGGWFIATVFNQAREMKSAFCQAEPVRMIIDDIETDIIQMVDEEIEAEWDAEYNKNVENKKFVSSLPSSEDILKKMRERGEIGSAIGPWAFPDDYEGLPTNRRHHDVDEDDIDLFSLRRQGFTFDEDFELTPEEEEELRKLDVGHSRKSHKNKEE